MQNLLPPPPPTLLPADQDADAALDAAGAGDDDTVPAGADRGWSDLKAVAARFPTYSAAWARLGDLALAAGDPVTAYAYARTGYHRGLDQLRRNGWRGHGPVPWSHVPNQGFLRCVNVLALAADAIGESDEAARCAQLLRDCDPAAGDALSS
ncbi:DUF3151 domain-containing protein [Planosporangium sp. 12N6]|uniref:DUF3151 domain-containing protein n=1 Tax=Planosporangium spinosum TaxID=3402278 RepID=UPI003CF1E2DA